VTCVRCGARSREGYAVPADRHCQYENDFGDPVTVDHDWRPTAEVEDG
jgi:hypothetical protein